MDHNRIISKLGELEKYITELKTFIPDDEDNYIKEIKTKRAIERDLQISIECVIDICFLLVNYLKLGPPSDEENTLKLLKNSLKTTKIISEMKGFRNILVHKYGMVNDKLVFKYLKENIDDFDTIISDFKKVLK